MRVRDLSFRVSVKYIDRLRVLPPHGVQQLSILICNIQMISFISTSITHLIHRANRILWMLCSSSEGIPSGVDMSSSC